MNVANRNIRINIEISCDFALLLTVLQRDYYILFTLLLYSNNIS